MPLRNVSCAFDAQFAKDRSKDVSNWGPGYTLKLTLKGYTSGVWGIAKLNWTQQRKLFSTLHHNDLRDAGLADREADCIDKSWTRTCRSLLIQRRAENSRGEIKQKGWRNGLVDRNTCYFFFLSFPAPIFNTFQYLKRACHNLIHF